MICLFNAETRFAKNIIQQKGLKSQLLPQRWVMLMYRGSGLPVREHNDGVGQKVTCEGSRMTLQPHAQYRRVPSVKVMVMRM